MIIKIPEDMKSYENKVFGNFTARQVVCMCISFLLIAPIFWIVFELTDSVDIAGYLAAFIGIPVVACGFIKKDGVYFEKIISAKWKSRTKYLQRRRFEMRNLYQDIEIIYKDGILDNEIAQQEAPKDAQAQTGKQGLKNKHDSMGKKKYSSKQRSLRNHE